MRTSGGSFTATPTTAPTGHGQSLECTPADTTSAPITASAPSNAVGHKNPFSVGDVHAATALTSVRVRGSDRAETSAALLYLARCQEPLAQGCTVFSFLYYHYGYTVKQTAVSRLRNGRPRAFAGPRSFSDAWHFQRSEAQVHPLYSGRARPSFQWAKSPAGGSGGSRSRQPHNERTGAVGQPHNERTRAAGGAPPRRALCSYPPRAPPSR